MKKTKLIYENMLLKSKEQHGCMFEYITYAPRAGFMCVPICVLHHGNARPLITLHAKGSCVRRFCRSARCIPSQPNVSHSCNRLRSLPTPTWQTEPRMCLGEGVIFNSCASIIKADSVCKINSGERSDYRLSAPL